MMVTRYSISSYGTHENPNGSYIRVEQFYNFLEFLTDHDDRDVMLNRINEMMEYLKEKPNDR